MKKPYMVAEWKGKKMKWKRLCPISCLVRNLWRDWKL